MTTTQDEALERLRRLLGGPQLARLRDRLRARCAKGDAPDEFTLAGLATAERRALEVLLGRPLRGSSSMRVRQSELDAVISRAGLAEHLRGALELLDGPIRNLRAERNSRQQAWNDTLNTLTDARLCALVSDSANVALLKRLSAGDAASAGALLAQVGFVLERLPAQGLPLARLAAESLADVKHV